MKGGSSIPIVVGPHIEKAGAARPAQIFAAGGREHVAADRSHIDRELADRLARIEQIKDAVAPCDLPDLRRRIDEPALRRHMGDRDEPGARADRAFECPRSSLPHGVVADHVDLDPGAGFHLQKREIVRQILRPPGDDAVAGPERHGVKCHVPGTRGTFDKRDLMALGADQPGDSVVEIGDASLGLDHRLHAADLGLARQMPGHRVEHDTRRQRHARIVEVEHVLHTGRLRPQRRHVERHVLRPLSR